MSARFTPRSMFKRECFYSTRNLEMMKAVESSKPYRDGRVDIVSIVGDNGNEITHSRPVTEFAKITTINGAIKKLVSEYGVNEKDILNKDDIDRISEELNVSFPNLKDY